MSISINHLLPRIGGIVIFFFLNAVISINGISAQPISSGSTEIDLDDFRTPTAPGFVLIGETPSAVERPETPKAFAVSLLSAGSQGDLIPENYALEVAPYWLVSHPKLTFEQRYDHKPLQTVLKNLSVSLVTTKIDDLPESGEVRDAVSLGLRSQFLGGKASSEMVDAINRLKIELKVKQLILLLLSESAEISTTMDEFKEHLLDTFLELENDPARLNIRELPNEERAIRIESMKKDALRYLSDKTASNEEEVKVVFESLQEMVTSDMTKVIQELREINKRPVGWVMEFAGAVAWDFRDNDFETGRFMRGGFWSTVTYRMPRPLIDFILVGRYIRDELGIEESNDVDVGARILYQYEKLGISAEFVERFKEYSDNTRRIVGILEYRVGEGSYVTASFGKDENLSDSGSLVSLIGINLGFGEKPVIVTNSVN
jgi:hypothetical protein